MIQDPANHERVGFILTDGSIQEVENVCHDPVNGFDVKAEDTLKWSDDAYATWHTHPGSTANLSFGDYNTFLNFPHLQHYIVGTDGVIQYSVSNGKVLIA